MKTMKPLFALFIALYFVGCKDNQVQKEIVGGEVIEETKVGTVPRLSDTYFEEALSAYKNNNKADAARNIEEGIKALEKEGNEVSGLYKLNLNRSIIQLRNIAGRLNDNFDISIEGFKEAVANAEINIAHNYLASEDLYVLTPKDKVAENNLHMALERNLNSLSAERSKLEGSAKLDVEKLDAEGKKLKDEFDDWKKRVEVHAKKVEEHFKKE